MCTVDDKTQHKLSEQKAQNRRKILRMSTLMSHHPTRAESLIQLMFTFSADRDRLTKRIKNFI